MNRNTYLGQPEVKAFVSYLAEVIGGQQAIRHTMTVVDRKVYPTFREIMEEKQLADAAFPSIRLTFRTLKDAFDAYWWAGEDYEQNLARLQMVQNQVRAAMQRLDLDQTLDALESVLRWGAGGTGLRLFTKNMAWARQQANLPELLAVGRKAMSGDNLDTSMFSNAASRARLRPRMNAGFTKYYALALQDCIIYDGRVGAAMGLLVRWFLSGPTGQAHANPGVPPTLHFRWATGPSGRPMNPSYGQLTFAELHNSARIWADCNLRANWVLAAARDQVLAQPQAEGQGWWFGTQADGLRRIEAALFVLGYEIV